MYKNPVPTVDCIIEKDGKIVLIKRGVEPFKGKLAIPGGYVDYGEKVEDAIVREVKEETGLDVKPMEILGVYSDKYRSPKHHVITTTFILKIVDGELKAGDDAENVGLYKIEELKKEYLAFDHYKIIQDYLKWKREGETYWSSK